MPRSRIPLPLSSLALGLIAATVATGPATIIGGCNLSAKSSGQKRRTLCQ